MYLDGLRAFFDRFFRHCFVFYDIVIIRATMGCGFVVGLSFVAVEIITMSRINIGWLRYFSAF